MAQALCCASPSSAIPAADGRLVEVQATAEKEPFSREVLDRLLDLAAAGIAELGEAQQSACATPSLL